jgi:lipoprotein-releasing system permease protein
VVNIISAIALVGVVVGTMALVVVLSIFNGFDVLIKSFFSVFDPEIKITSVEGKH